MPPRNAQNPTLRALTGLIKRRHALTMAATALSIAGCGMVETARETPPNLAPPTSPQRELADQRVRAFTSGIEMSLDAVDRERLRAAAEKKIPVNITPATVTTVNAADIATPVSSANIEIPDVSTSPEPEPSTLVTGATSLDPVILASTEGEDTHGTPGAPTAGHGGSVAPTPSPTPPTPAQHITPPESNNHSPAPVAPSQATPPAGGITPPQLFMPITPPAVMPAVSPPAAAVIAPAPGIRPDPVPAAHPSETPSAVITPISVSNDATPSAMGAMTALPTPAANTTPPEVQVANASPPESHAPVVTPEAAAEPTVEQALAILQKHIAAQPTLNTALALALLNVPEANPTDGTLTKNLSEADRKVLADLVAAFETMKSGAPGATLSDRTAPLLDATKKWGTDADLSLPKLALASRVDSFGVYTELPPRFEQGKRHTVIIYCEVANFNSKKSEDGWFTTKLAQQETLITEDGLLVWRPNSEEVEDRSRNQRHDFYLVKKLTIPENLAAGKYTLRMSVTDRNSNKISVVSLPIEIGK